MAFEGPTDGDFSNVAALNKALLDIIAVDPTAIAMPPKLGQRLARAQARAVCFHDTQRQPHGLARLRRTTQHTFSMGQRNYRLTQDQGRLLNI